MIVQNLSISTYRQDTFGGYIAVELNGETLCVRLNKHGKPTIGGSAFHVVTRTSPGGWISYKPVVSKRHLSAYDRRRVTEIMNLFANW